jgi:uncharacterized protein YbaP (TraB family)
MFPHRFRMKGTRGFWQRVLAALVIGLAPWSAVAETGTLLAPQEEAKIMASPALWTVHGQGGSVAYLFGSIHLVPQQMDWRSPPVVQAMQRSDTFVFEVPLNDQTEHAVAAYIKDNGTLAPGMSLREMLSPQAKIDYDAALEQTGLRLEDVDTMRPWLASITFDVTDMMRRNYDPGGVDKQIFAWALRQGKNTDAFETVADQLAILAPGGPKLEMEGFELELKDLKHASNIVGPLVDAWAHGDVATIDRISNDEMKKYPHVQKAVFTDRNARWAKSIQTMLRQKPRTYFIVVGAAHLAGSGGVPALLRKAGFTVDGP